jgi:hypothetical protein
MNYLINKEIPKINKSYYRTSMPLNNLCINYQHATVHYYQKINEEQYVVSGQLLYLPEATSSGRLVSNEEFEKQYVVVQPSTKIKPSVIVSLIEEDESIMEEE